MLPKRLAVFLLSLELCSPVLADSAYIEGLVAAARETELATSRDWRSLLHYKPTLLGGWESQADDEAFFLADEGKTDPEAELAATVRAMAEPATAGVDHAQCRFPARYHWLKATLDIDAARLEPVPCEELQQWFNTLRPGSLTLVFPAAYINSPSSMFGHTLLRVNPDDHRKDLPLVSYALNYAADADAGDNGLMFSIKGLIGGYPGIFSIVPYYDKIREYSDLENRDIWEYELDFSEDDVRQLMRHAWEVRHIRFDYYFLTENCSYHMLSLMEAARPELDLTSAFDVKAIPSDTVRAVVDAGLVRDELYRPSSTMKLTQHAGQLSDEENELVQRIIAAEVSVDEAAGRLTEERQAMVFEQAYDFARFLSTADPSTRDARAGLNWQLLAARSELGLRDVWAPLVHPDVRAEEGHRTGRFAAGFGRLATDDFISLQIRPAFHDVVDPPAGYAEGAQINFIDLHVRAFLDSEVLRLQKLTFINVLSRTPRSEYFSPISWGADFAVERQPTRSSTANALQLVVDGGVSYGEPGRVFSLLGEFNVKAAGRYDKGYSAGVGIGLGLLLQDRRFSMQTRLRAVRFDAGEQNLHQQFDVAAGLHDGVDSALRLTFERSRDYGRYRTDIQLSWHRYF